MINRYYQEELTFLRELAVEFSKAHPALAPILSGPAQDPDVERLLEGTAFLTGMLRQKLDDEFPEVIHGLLQLIFPHYLRPIPSTTIMAFQPKQSLMEPLKVPAGVALASIPVAGTSCTFRTCYDVEVHPLNLVDARFKEEPGHKSSIELSFELKGRLSNWPVSFLRLYLSQSYSTAATLYYLFFNHVESIRITPKDGGNERVLPPDALQPVGFSNKECLFPYPPQSFPGYRVLQEYFILPEKFLFFDIAGLDGWRDRGSGSGFNITFQLDRLPSPPIDIKKDQFLLFATPAVNLFPFDAEPIQLDHRLTEYRVRPSGAPIDHYKVYSVEKVTGFMQGVANKRDYVPFELFSSQSDSAPIYHLNHKISAISADAEISLSVAYPPESGLPVPETLSVRLMCTNSALPQNLHTGDISKPTSTSPELCDFRNIRPPTSPVLPPLGKNLLWCFLSHLSLNLLSLANLENLKALLRLYIFSDSRDQAGVAANEKRVDGISRLSITPKDRLVSGMVLRGQEIHLTLNPDHFASLGDMYLFGSILNHFLGTYASINCFTQFKVTDELKGDVYQWPARVGDRPLI